VPPLSVIPASCILAFVLQSTHEDKDYVHIVMELCNGGELFDHIVEAQHFTERKVCRPASQQWQLNYPRSSEVGVMQPSKPETAAARQSSIAGVMRCNLQTADVHGCLQEQPIQLHMLFNSSGRGEMHTSHRIWGVQANVAGQQAYVIMFDRPC
jgi:hypothetical protein